MTHLLLLLTDFFAYNFLYLYLSFVISLALLRSVFIGAPYYFYLINYYCIFIDLLLLLLISSITQHFPTIFLRTQYYLLCYKYHFTYSCISIHRFPRIYYSTCIFCSSSDYLSPTIMYFSYSVKTFILTCSTTTCYAN